MKASGRKLLISLLLLLCVLPVSAQDSDLPPALAEIQYGEIINEVMNRDGILTFTFRGNEGDRVVITANSNDIDTWLSLHAPDEDVIAYNDDYSNLNAQIGPIELPQAGSYTVVVGSYWVQTGNFTLSLLTDDMIIDLSEVELTLLASEREVQGGERIYAIDLNRGDVATIVVTAWDPIGAIVVDPSADLVGEVTISQPLRFQAQETGEYYVNIGWVPEKTSSREYEVLEGCTRDGRCKATIETELVVIPNDVSFSVSYHVQLGDASGLPSATPIPDTATATSADETPTTASSAVCAGDGEVTVTLRIDEVTIYDSVEAQSAFSSGGDEALLIYAVLLITDDAVDAGVNNEYVEQWEEDAYDGDRFSNFDSISRVLNCGETAGVLFDAYEDDRPFGEARNLGTQGIEIPLTPDGIANLESRAEIRFTGSQYDSPHDYGISYTITITAR